MTKKEWQEHHGFTDQDMDFITWILETFNGKIIKVIMVSVMVRFV